MCDFNTRKSEEGLTTNNQMVQTKSKIEDGDLQRRRWRCRVKIEGRGMSYQIVHLQSVPCKPTSGTEPPAPTQRHPSTGPCTVYNVHSVVVFDKSVTLTYSTTPQLRFPVTGQCSAHPKQNIDMHTTLKTTLTSPCNIGSL